MITVTVNFFHFLTSSSNINSGLNSYILDVIFRLEFLGTLSDKTVQLFLKMEVVRVSKQPLTYIFVSKQKLVEASALPWL